MQGSRVETRKGDFDDISIVDMALDKLLSPTASGFASVQWSRYLNRILIGSGINVVLVQILNPPYGQGPDVAEIDAEIRSSCERINEEMGSPGYEPIVLVNRPISLGERVAYYVVSEAAIVTPVCDGMNLMPYEYVVRRQGDDHRNYDSPKTSMLVVSEFIGCSPTLSGAIRVNPWDVKATAEAMNTAISASDDRKQLGHIKHYRYITTHDIANWSRSFVRDLQTSCIAHNHNNWRSLGLAITFRVAIFNSNFQKLTAEVVENAYRRNTVFVISGRSKENLGRWFGLCEKLAIAAEHGYFISFVTVKSIKQRRAS
ncbi:hypothetical protein L6452_35595 [Arctium lappa]|uniref:Uncharacterized protein n=1 Tax=Arctium lappa TaxID=4217 RepID=A0ACB8Y7I3_ARCLA|nr:hypothetical protein L6452_35595 [Arctium lappa]